MSLRRRIASRVGLAVGAARRRTGRRSRTRRRRRGPTDDPARRPVHAQRELQPVRRGQLGARLDAGHRARPHGDGQREPRPHGAAVVLLGPRAGRRLPVRQRGQLRLHELPAGHHDQPRRGRHGQQRQLRRAPARPGQLVHQRRAAAAARNAAGSRSSTGMPRTPTSTARSSSSSRPARAAAPNFKDIPIHAGGVSWYGDYLYVADTGHGMRVFDMRKILKTNTGGTADQIGRQTERRLLRAQLRLRPAADRHDHRRARRRARTSRGRRSRSTG